MKTHIRNFLIGFAFLAAGLATAATFNLFQPASGILVGNPSTYITTAATSANIVATFSGTCNGGTVLKGDGSCAAVVTSPAGSDTQVQFNDAGAFGADAGLVYNKTTDLLTAGSLNAASLTAPSTLLLNATGANQIGFFTNSIARFAIGSAGDWSVGGGVGTNGQVLTSSGPAAMPTWTTVSGGGSGANPTALVGLTAINGAAGTFTRSDGAPALDQGIAPTWTATHTYSQAFPKLLFNTSGAGANAKNTLLQFFNTSFSFASATDASPLSSVTDAIATTRSGTAWTSVNFGNTSDNPTYKFFGTGATTFGNTSVNANILAEIINPSGGATARSEFKLTNSTNSWNNALFSTNGTQVGWTGGPLGQQMFTGSSAAIPWSLGVGGTERIGVTSAGVVNINGQAARDTALFTSGTLAVARGGTGTTTSTGTGSVVLSAAPALTGAATLDTVPIAKTSAAHVNSGGTLQNGTNAASSTNLGTGSYSVTWTTAYTNPPVCTGVQRISGYVTFGTVPSTTQVFINTVDNTGTAPTPANVEFWVTCVGT